MSQTVARQERLKSLLAANNLDAVIMAKPANILYYSNFNGDDSWLVVGKDQIVLLTDGRYTAQAAIECPDIQVLCQGGLNGSWLDLLQNTLKNWQAKTLGIEGAIFSYRQFAQLKEILSPCDITLYDGGDLADSLRQVKDNDEIDKLQKAAAIGDQALKTIEKFLCPGVTEGRLAAEIEYAFKLLGAEGVSFATIVAAGLNGAKPHAKPGDYQLQDGDLVTIDMGCVYQGYCSDMTRTFAIGKIDSKQKTIYDLVLKAQTHAVANIKPGMTCKEADALARDIIDEAGYGQYFSHSLGHGVGLEIHEEPSLRATSEQILVVGNVVTVEPGVYIPNWGGVRIEDTVIITNQGAELITHYPKKLQIFG